MPAHRDSLHGRHAEQVRGVLSHTDNLRYNLDLCPLDAKHFRQFLQIDSCRFPDAVHVVTQPRHAQVTQLFIEEILAQLGG